jgi:16S rRNA (uracil1498-N3)-methyltransferase
MAVPYFYFAHLSTMADEFMLNENSSRHIVQVLRMQQNDKILLTDGRGLSVLATIQEANKKKSTVRITEKKLHEAPGRKVQIGLSLLKNASRFEWFLEKATELGVSEIIPLKCTRTEKLQFRLERMYGILESALIQSQQVWMPVMNEPRDFNEYVKEVKSDQKLIAHCEPGSKKKLAETIDAHLPSQIILIGPEGDFTPEEIRGATDVGFIAVELGQNRLRSETAAIAAAAVLTLL